MEKEDFEFKSWIDTDNPKVIDSIPLGLTKNERKILQKILEKQTALSTKDIHNELKINKEDIEKILDKFKEMNLISSRPDFILNTENLWMLNPKFLELYLSRKNQISLDIEETIAEILNKKLDIESQANIIKILSFNKYPKRLLYFYNLDLPAVT